VGSESCPLSPRRVFRSGSRRIRAGAPLYFDALRRRRHGACASRMTQTPPPATTSRSRSRKRFVTSGQLNPSPTGGPAWPQQRKTSGRVGHPVERDGQRALFNVAPQTQSKQLSPCEFMQPLPTPIPTSRSRCPAAPSSRSPAPSPIKTGGSPGPLMKPALQFSSVIHVRVPNQA